MPDNYPSGTWAGDPNAPWNKSECAVCSDECVHYRLCPCGASVYCVANDEWFEPREANEEYECFEAKR